MELRLLTTFLKVAQLQSFSKAAESLGYSQSAVTVQVQQLENELGVRLFDRIGKTVSITTTGRSSSPTRAMSCRQPHAPCRSRSRSAT